MSDGSTDGETSSGRGATESEWTQSRRAFLAAGASVSAVSLVGCLGGDGGTPTETDSGDGGDDETATPTATATENYPDEVVIGSIHPLSGSTSYVGTRLHQAIKFAAKRVNDNGGIESMGGATVTVIKGDHKNDPTTGGEVARELIDQGADMLTGTYSSPVASSVAQVAETQQVPFVIDIAADTSILQERDLQYTYRAQPNSRSQSLDAVEGIMALTDQADITIETAGLFYIDNTYGEAYRDALTEAFEERGVEVVADTTISFGGTADTQVTKFRETDPDVIVPTVFTRQALELVSSMQDQDYWPKVLAACASGGMNSENFKKMGEVINGELSAGYQIDMTQDRVTEINEAYQETYDTAPMKGNVGMAYSTGEVLVEAFAEAGSVSPDALISTLDEIEVSDHVMAMPPITFDDSHENANGLTITNQVQDMEAKVVYPEEWATAELNPDTIGRN